jgi:hypothetical protein
MRGRVGILGDAEGSSDPSYLTHDATQRSVGCKAPESGEAGERSVDLEMLSQHRARRYLPQLHRAREGFGRSLQGRGRDVGLPKS